MRWTRDLGEGGGVEPGPRPTQEIHGDVIYGPKVGRDYVNGDMYVGVDPDQRPRAGQRKVILLMSADPDPRRPLRLDEEHREIDLAVTYAQAGDRLEVRTAGALRLRDLQAVLVRHRPTIAHFSGHGSAAAGIMVHDDRGGAAPVPPSALRDLFGILRDPPRCVVLNACFTDEQARAIAEHVPHVVGMHRQVLDDAAIHFAAGFYQGIAYGEPVGVAFELGRNRMSLNGYADAALPRYIAAPGAEDRPVIKRRTGG